jgi:hypothetical protein
MTLRTASGLPERIVLRGGCSGSQSHADRFLRFVPALFRGVAIERYATGILHVVAQSPVALGLNLMNVGPLPLWASAGAPFF